MITILVTWALCWLCRKADSEGLGCLLFFLFLLTLPADVEIVIEVIKAIQSQ